MQAEKSDEGLKRIKAKVKNNQRFKTLIEAKLVGVYVRKRAVKRCIIKEKEMMIMDKNLIHQWIDDHKDEMISQIREIVAVKSVEGESKPGAPFGEGPKAALDKFIEICQRHNFETGVFEDQVGWADWGDPQAEYVGILAHVDVVPEGEGWSCDPYEGKIENGMLYGRGVADDKGPAICSLFAMKALRECGVKLARRVRLMVGTNEETGSAAVHHYVESGMPLPVCGFTPDADFPLINGEKGMVSLKLALPFSAKGQTFYVTDLKAGMASNAVPAKASCVVHCDEDRAKKVERALLDWVPARGIELTHKKEGDGFSLSVKGISCHAMHPQKGASALAELVAFLRLLELDGEQGVALQKLDDSGLDQAYGQSLGIAVYDHITGFSSMCVGLMNQVGEKIEFTWNYRYPVTMNPEEMNTRVVKAAEDRGFEILEKGFTRPLYIPEDDPLVVKLMKAYKDETGRDERPFAIGGGTYAKAMKNMVAFGLCFPEEKQHIHEVDERWEIDRIILSTKILAAAIAELGEVVA